MIAIVSCRLTGRARCGDGGFTVKFSGYGRSIVVFTLITALLSACSLDPNVRKQKYFQKGQSYFAKGKYQEAAIEFTNSIKIDSGYADAHFQLAETYLHLQQGNLAYKELTRTLELRPEDYKARIDLANLLILGHKLQDAQAQVDLLLKKRPDDPGVHVLAANLLAVQGKILDAIAEMQRGIALDPGRWEPHLSLALLQVKNLDFAAAEASFKKVIELNPKAMQPHLALGEFYQSQKRFGEAEQEFRSALAIDSTTIGPREALARLYMAEGKKADAEEVLKQAVHDLPHNPDSFLALSNFYYVTGDLDKSVAEYHALFLERPKDLVVRKKYIELLLQAKRYDEARSLNDEILKANPKDDDALVNRSQMQINSGDVSNAEQTLQAVVKDVPNNIQAHYALGVAFQKQGNLTQAVSEWREALRLNPNFLDAQRAIADATMHQGDMNGLQDAANQMIRLQPGSPEGYALRALANINAKHYPEAEQDVRRAIAAAPQSVLGYVQMGNLRFVQKQYSDAAKAYQEALDRNADSTDALRGLMNTYVAEKQIDKAIAAANAQIQKSPNNSRFYELLGSALVQGKNDLSGGEAAFAKSAALDKNNSDAVIQLCQVRAARGEIDQAIATGEQSLKDNPRQPNLYVVLGDLYELKSDWKKAEGAFQSSLALNSQNPVASNELARVMLQTGENLDVALSLAQKARAGLPNSPGVADTIGWIYYRKGVYPLAITFLKEALDQQEKDKLPDNPDFDYHLGWACEKAGQPALARQHFEHVLKIRPNYPAAAEIKNELSHLKS
jgi:tetratricopeptide (TPR) repeat protein